MDQADVHLSRLDALLFNGTGGEELLSLIKGVINHLPSSFWLLIPVLFIGLLGYVVLSFGELGHVLSRGFLYFFVVVLCIFILYPFYVMLITGFRSNTETTDMHFLHMLPTKWVWSNIPDIISRNVLTYLFNSILLSTGATLIAMLCGIPAAYAMARMNFKGKKAFLGFVIMSQMFSPVVLLVGISTLMNTIRLNDSIIGLMLINAAFNQAFAIWLLRGTFVSISSEMEQAACIDGCNSVTALIRILLPMAAPGIVTTLIFVFINAWNEYTISTVLISTPAFKPITVGITQFSSFNMIEWHYLFAAALLATIPVVILFMCIEKHLVSGLTSGGVKG
ncbi:MAG: carbohydrate ABC transporter permease [Clostridia bacterium]|nr:carbohydrate ABC transporter permease [Clostridia bacterium]